MDKPQIDLEKLKQIRDKKNKTETNGVDIIGTSGTGWILTEEGWIKAGVDESLTDPYYDRHHIINIRDFDEWEQLY